MIQKILLLPELGASLFEIAKSLIALERTMILGAMRSMRKRAKSDEELTK